MIFQNNNILPKCHFLDPQSDSFSLQNHQIPDDKLPYLLILSFLRLHKAKFENVMINLTIKNSPKTAYSLKIREQRRIL
jgi:hypothetical protein